MINELTHDELAHSLAQHLQSDSRMVWEDIPAGMAGEVRPDVYTIQKSFANPNPITYEVKVSVADFRSDVTKAKWKAYLRFSYGVVFAVPKGLITKKDLPDSCGLITYSGTGIWHTVKRPTLNPCKIDSDILLKLLMGGAERMTQSKPIQNRDFNKWKHTNKLREKFGKDIAEKIAVISEYPAMKKELKSLKKELSNVLGVEVDRWNFANEIKYKIDEIRIMADETERKKAIAKDLEKLKSSIIGDINRSIQEYTK